MTNKIMFSTDYVGVVTVGLYYTTSDPEFSYYSTSPDIEVGIVTASNLYVSGIVSTTNMTVGVATASEFYGSFIGTVVGTASTASFATTAFSLEGNPDISVGIATASSFVGDLTGTASTASFATTSFSLEGNPDISVGIVTATGGFISSASTTPIQINFDSGTNSIIFSIVGIGTTSLVLF
jgi:hypothetical protein